MGTNYYYRTRKCPTCGRSWERHIGKSSAGWTFSFRGYENLRSYKDWLAVLESDQDGQIVDEYERPISLQDFKAMIDRKKNEPKNHSRECPEIYNWLDNEGNSFSERDFS